MKNTDTALANTEMQELSDCRTGKFYEDVICGLKSTPKFLSSMYFYDAVGDKLFQDLMACDEYYPTNCETEIFAEKTADICKVMAGGGDAFDLIELGAGDATKSTYLLKQLMQQSINFDYLPIDISSNVISYLNMTLPVTIPGLNITGLNGEYFDMLKKASAISDKRKVIMFLGSNIGNMPVDAAEDFCRNIRAHLSPGDMMLIGVDLKKNPHTILAAYNDEGGITKQFNLNLLERINRELNADFDVSKFEHYPTYDPESGACKSYLISLADQTARIGESETVTFAKDEYIFMEISQKFTVAQIDDMAAKASFKPVTHFFDSKHWFTDAIWIAQ
ncbi:MAG TPA: L-histidine N(alpha)-methyltransferase [Mucilaginibacter sp.]|nr:L-histidine N(alpha)-methyltransferase [Mucilaginibacter sp.]